MQDLVTYALQDAVEGVDHDLVLILDTHHGVRIERGPLVRLEDEAVCLRIGDRPLWINRKAVLQARVIPATS